MGAQALQPGDIGFKSSLVHQTLIAGCDGLGHGELVGLTLTEIFKTPDGGVAGERCGDEAGLALVGGRDRSNRRK